MISLDDFDYHLPESLIAYRPSKVRDQSRMMVVSAEEDNACITSFSKFPDNLSKGDCLVLNDTKVIPARLIGKKETGAKIEALLMHPLTEGVWQIMARPTKRLKVGTKVFVSSKVFYTIIAKNDDGSCQAKFEDDVLKVLDKYGEIPLPPYINRPSDEDDIQRYQTVYARESGAVAAPTAGLHFTDDTFRILKDKGINVIYLTLHVGAGTFLPVTSKNVINHKMHSEAYSLSEQSAEVLNSCKKAGKKIFAVGTTTVRVLETCYKKDKVVAGSGWTDIFIYPPYKMKMVDGLLTNFHLPKSTLLMLVSCMIGRKRLLSFYQQAINEKMNFFSYGDCMLILPAK